MKRIAWWLFVFMLWTVKVAETQDPNPQTSFSTTLLYAQPSLYLNFNDFSTNFLDQISGLTFSGTVAPTITSMNVGAPAANLSTLGSGSLGISGAPLVAGMLTGVQLQFHTAPTAGQALTILILTGSGTSYTIVNSFTVNVAATTALQTFTAPTSFTAISVAAGNLIGFWSAAGTTPGYNGQPVNGWYSTGNATLPSGAATYTAYGGGMAIAGVVTPPCTICSVVPRQPGFDSTQINNTSAEFPYNGYSVAPNNTLGAIDWDVPWTMLVHIDRLNWNRTGTLVLASKGDSSSTGNDWWKLYIQMSGLYSQLCFARNGFGSVPTVSGGTSIAATSICTSSGFDAVPNGFNYDIVVTDNGAGNGGAAGHLQPPALALYLNGLDSSYIPETATGGAIGFGYVGLTLSGSGTGYANSTAYTSSGGGPNCDVAGVMTSVGGVPSTLSPGPTSDWGCTSAPTIVFTAPTGTGETITATPSGASMNATTLPLLVPGYVSANAYYGVAGLTTTQTSTYVDEFAVFPNVISQTALQGIFYQTKFYQIPNNTVPANRRKIIFSDDGCSDIDDAWALQVLIAADNVGYVNLVGVDNDQINNDASPFIFRQMLDQAGKANIMVGVTSSGTPSYTGWCVVSYITAYNASTPQNFSAYPSAVTMFRTVLAANPTTPVDIFSAGALTGISAFMQSAPDSISSLTGMQLWNQDATNGAAMYLQGGPTCNAPSYCTTTSTTTSDNVLVDPVAGQYVMANHAAMPMYMLGGTPASSGPGPTFTRTGKDPMFGAATAWFTATGSLTRQGWDSLAAASLLSNLYQGGVYVTYSGGTGYANSTPFTLSGGGANCAGSGIMTASGGVPNGITYIWGASAQVYQGLGNGCTSTPTVNLIGATGAGVTLTAYPTSVCVTDRVTQPGGVWTDGVNSTTCDNQYVQPFSQYAAPSGTGVSWPIFSGWLNSLINPPPNGAPKVQ